MFIAPTSPAKANSPNVKRKNDFPSDDFSPQLKKPKTQAVQPTTLPISSNLKTNNEHLNINPSELSFSDADFEVEEEDFFSSERIFDQLYHIDLLLPDDNENDLATQADPEASYVSQLQKRQKYLGNLIKLHQLQLGWIAESFDEKQKALIQKQLKISEMLEQKQRFKQAQSPVKNNANSYNANSNLLQDRIASQVLNQFGLKGSALDYNTHASQELYQATLKGTKPTMNVNSIQTSHASQGYYTPQQVAYAQQLQQYQLQQQQLQAAAAASGTPPKVGDNKQIPRANNPTTLLSATATGSTAPFYMPLSPEQQLQAQYLRAGQDMSSAYQQQYAGYGYNYPGTVSQYNMQMAPNSYPYQAATNTKQGLPSQMINNQKPQLTQQKLVPSGQQSQPIQAQQQIQPQQQ